MWRLVFVGVGRGGSQVLGAELGSCGGSCWGMELSGVGGRGVCGEPGPASMAPQVTQPWADTHRERQGPLVLNVASAVQTVQII